MLSSTTQQFDVSTNRLYVLRDQLVKQGERMTDLVSGNVNAQGIHFPQGILLRALARGLKQSKTYRPDPLGQASARTAISRYYGGEGLDIPSEQLLLTPGTSISYWYAFKILANPGDEILCPAPSYPLFDSIAVLCGTKRVSYRLREADRWEIDFKHLESVITPRTKAIVLISPHNPTGAVTSEEEIGHLAAIASRKTLPIIADEVFSPFLFKLKRLPRPAATAAPLVITLNGFSKMLALPGLKIGWMAVTGDPALVQKSMKALDMISDTFLPVNEAAQFAVPALLRHSGAFQASYVSEIRKRMECAAILLRDQKKISFVEPEGGFFLTLRLEGKGVDEDEIALRLLQKNRILLHPGYFYDMERRHLVLSFVSRTTIMRKALNAVIGQIQ